MRFGGSSQTSGRRGQCGDKEDDKAPACSADSQRRFQFKLAEGAGHDPDRRTDAETDIPIREPVPIANGGERFAIDLESESRRLIARRSER